MCGFVWFGSRIKNRHLIQTDQLIEKGMNTSKLKQFLQFAVFVWVDLVWFEHFTLVNVLLVPIKALELF